MRILLVEDESSLRSQLKDRLEAKGYSVDDAADGENGLFLGREYPMDLAIIDLGLPGISGMELIRRLRAAGSRLPILILTARGRWQGSRARRRTAPPTWSSPCRSWSRTCRAP
jgi:two-component system response regulator PhoP